MINGGPSFLHLNMYQRGDIYSRGYIGFKACLTDSRVSADPNLTRLHCDLILKRDGDALLCYSEQAQKTSRYPLTGPSCPSLFTLMVFGMPDVFNVEAFQRRLRKQRSQTKQQLLFPTCSLCLHCTWVTGAQTTL